MTALCATSFTGLRFSLAALLLSAAFGAHANGNDNDGSFLVGLNIQASTSPQKLGLPYYPGAVPHVTKGDEKPGAGIVAWGGFFGLQLQAMKLRSSASPEAVAQWYHAELARLGPVLDCSQGKAADPPALPDKKADKQVLRCGDDRPEPGGALYKLGTRADARVVSVKPGEPAQGGSRIALVRIQLKNVD